MFHFLVYYHSIFSAAAIFLITVVGHAHAKPFIYMMPPQGQADTSHQYLVDILNLALTKTEAVYGKSEIVFIDENYSQGRAIRLLQNKGLLDIVASGPTRDREALYRPVRIPLMKGLLGYRVLVIKRTDHAKFASIDSMVALKSLIACQATHWPDSDILDSNGFKVQRVTHFQSMFEMVRTGRCDYFPRAITEGYSEVEKVNEMSQQQDLMVFDDIILRYTFPYYFFTGHHNFELAARIEKGLKIALKDGSFDAFMRQHSIMQHLYPLKKWRSKRYFQLDNPLLTKATPLEIPWLWLQLETNNSSRPAIKPQ